MNNYCAIFDFDETIIKFKSMFGVLEQYFINQSDCKDIGKRKFKEFKENLLKFSKACENRSELNIFYYQQLAGVLVKDIQLAAKMWFIKNRENIFNNIVLKEITYHRKYGAKIIVVTGSFIECITPITEYLGITHIICSKPEKISGIYTGKILSEPVIGSGKKSQLIKYLKIKNLSLNGSYAYGDHETDIPFLSLAENPHVVGNNKILRSYAMENDWAIIEL